MNLQLASHSYFDRVPHDRPLEKFLTCAYSKDAARSAASLGFCGGYVSNAFMRSNNTLAVK